MDDKRGQRAKKCDYLGCNEYGRTLATLGGNEIAYCPKHRKKYGERIINALINSSFNYKLTNFLTEVKTEIFFGSNLLGIECGSNVRSYILNKTEELDSILDYAETNEIKNFDIETRDKV